MEKTIEVKKEVNSRAVRFSQAPWYTENIEVIIGGLGGIGSYLAYYLGRQDCEMHMYDFDTVEETNLGGQMYTSTDAKAQLTKTAAAMKNALQYSLNNNCTTYDKYTKTGLSSNFMFSCFDNLDARKYMFENWLEYVIENPEEQCLFVDGRMSAENFDVFFVKSYDKEGIQKYKDDLYSDVKIEELPCNFKATSHCGAMCAGLMVSGFNNFITNVNLKEDIRDIPRKISVQLAFFNIEIKWT